MVKDELPSLTLSVAETLERWPLTHGVLAARGLDTCCGGVHSVGAAAGAHGVDPELLIVELRAAAAGETRRAELDLRGLTPPEPMTRVLTALAELDKGEEFDAILPHAPVPLYALLAERGASWETVGDEPGRFVLRVRRGA